MSVFLKASMAALLSIALVACGGAGSSSKAGLLERTESYNALFDRSSRAFPSGPSTVENMTGKASFTGAGVVAVNPDRSFQYGDAILLGDAQIDVNFRHGKVDGAITNVFGFDSRNEIDEYSGAIKISGGNIGSGAHNGISADYAGTIRGNGDTIKVNGQMDGTLLGNPKVHTIDMTDVTTGTLNGSTAYTVVGVVVERD